MKIINRKKILIIIYLFLISFIILMFSSKNSFLYPFNDWVDANAFFTVDKSMLHGIVPYKYIFEQKGPLLYLIYGFASLISFKTFFGVFILEVLFWTVALIYFYKILKLFCSTKTSLIIIPIFVTIIVTSKAFTHGGSAEEFCIPFFFITLYYFIKHFKVKDLTKKEMLLNGIIAGLVLLIKYTLLGFWISFTLSIFIDFILKKDYKNSFIYPIILLLGMFIPLILFLLYFGLNGAIYDFFYNYFWINITAYNGEQIGIFAKIYQIVIGCIKAFGSNIIGLIIILLIPIFIWKLDLKKRAKILLMISILISILGVYYGLKFYRYYLLFILFFISIGLIVIFNLVDNYINKINNRLYNVIIISVLLVSIFNSYYNANYKEYLNIDIKDLFQYEFAQIINAEENPTMVNMGHLDCGVYTLSGLIPTTYFFEEQNISYQYFPDNIDAFRNYIKNKTTMFIVYFTQKNEKSLKNKEVELFNNYDLIKVRKQNFEDKHYYGYLFKVKE